MKYRFDACELDTSAHTLSRRGEDVHVEPQVFDVLRLLAEAAGELVSYDRLIEVVWQGRIVSDATLAARISAARTAVGDSGKAQRVIETVTRRGVRLIVPVTFAEAKPTAAAAVPERQQTVRMTTSEDGTMIAWSSGGDGPALMRAGHWLTHLEKDVTSSIWGPWIARLNNGRHLVRYDPRGTGMSSREVAGTSIDLAVADMLAVADAAGLERFSILASSQSAAIAFHFAARCPDRIDRIVTVGAFIQGTRVRTPVDGGALSDTIELMIRQGWGKPNSGFLRSLGTMFMPGASEDELNEILDLQAASADAERAVLIRNTCSFYDEVPILAQVKAPVLVAHALDDSIHPFSQAQLIAAHLPDARILQLDTSNHLLSPREPAFGVLMDAVDQFLA